jgi:CRP-like cAMP-binding protein
MADNPKEASIGSIPFFKGLPTPDLMAILGITVTKNIEAGETLFTQNDPSDGLYILLSGKLQIYIFSGFSGGAPKVLAELNPGQYVGEMGLLDGQNRSASVKVLEGGEVMFMPTAGFAVLLQSHPKIAKEVVDSLCEMINNKPKLVINSEKATLIQDKRVAPTLSNMKLLCTILREYNKRMAVSGK